MVGSYCRPSLPPGCPGGTRRRRRKRLWVLSSFMALGHLLLGVVGEGPIASGQQVEGDLAVQAVPGGALTPEQVEKMKAQAAAQRPSAEGKAPTDAAAGGEGQGKPGGGNSGQDAEGGLKVIQRSPQPPEPPDPAELQVVPDEQGLVSFHFRNQPWLEVMRWYARVCNLALDWQELPGDYINLMTRRPYTLDEAGDLINRALLMRGFTMLRGEDTLTVVKVEGLNPALVPRVEPNQLVDLPPHQFVRTSFSLQWMLAEEVHEEFSAMLSKNGKLTPLPAANRLEAMDAVANLRDIYAIIQEEESAVALQNLAREFPLKYARAATVKMQLEAFLGLQSSSSTGGGGSPGGVMDMSRMMQQQMQQLQQQMQQQMQQAAQGRGGGGPARPTRSDKVYLVANDRTNSVIVHAPPDKMALVESFIARVDVPNENAVDFQRLNARMRVFRLASLSPSELVATLTAMDVLEPQTRLQVDAENNAIIAYASVADQFLIQSVIERLDGSARSFHVIQLRRLDAEAVAGSIRFLMGVDDDEEDDRSRYRPYYYDFYSRRNTEESKPKDKMRVGANVQDNQLLLWVNEVELQEIHNLLMKLGELPPEGGNRSTIRVIDASRKPETYRYLLRLKEQWERVAPNPLILPDANAFADPGTATEEAKSEGEVSEEKTEEADATGGSPRAMPTPDSRRDRQDTDRTSEVTWATEGMITGGETPVVSLHRLVSLQGKALSDEPQSVSATEQPAAAEGQTAAESPPATPSEEIPQRDVPPVVIAIDEAGRLVLQSADPAALDRLEQLMQVNRPPQRRYDVFKVQHVPATWVVLQLEEYFDTKEEEPERPYPYWFFFDDFERDDKEEPSQLGRKQPLRFVADSDTGTIVVQGADDIDRQTIKELIELWDVPPPVDEETVRYTRLVRIRYSKAEVIAATIKDAYRDLLSANDPAVQRGRNNNGTEEEKRAEGGVQDGGGMSFSFKGKLSLGVDALTNSILVSAEGMKLLELVVAMIEELDQAAKTEGQVSVYTLPAGISGKSLEKSLRAMFEAPKQPPQGQPGRPGQPANPPQPGQPPNGGAPAGAAPGFDNQ
ncbi:MAG: hypothetical protein KatS3mg111_0511 [Pirellulaceae bacterium]|nr:MAG: hypothetical protein KatS3mg111_0511 [Pirellulaceae bacterium]